MDALKSIGINAECTLSWEKATELVIQRRNKGDDYQIILLDWKLPGMNGIQAAKEIRRNLGDKVPRHERPYCKANRYHGSVTIAEKVSD